MRLVLFLTLTVLSAQTVGGQDITNYRYHDSLTYNLYLESRWKELSAAGNEALADGNDYYFLRMRLGIAGYERSNYASAAGHFRNALVHNPNDPIALEYIFYCHFFNGEYASATKILQQLSAEQRMKITKESGLAKNAISLSLYYNDFMTEDITDLPSAWFPDYETGTQSVSQLIVNPSVSMSHYIKPGVYYSHSYNNVTKISFLHYFDGVSSLNLDKQKVFQNQYYGSFVFGGQRGFSFRPYIHAVFLVFDYIQSTGGMIPGYYVMRGSDFNYSAGMNFRQRSGYFAVDGGVALNNFGYGVAVQWEAGLKLYPLGNSNLYTGGRITSVKQPDAYDYGSSGPVFTANAGFQVPGIIMVDFTAIEGEFRNMTTNNGLYVFNSPDFITSRLQMNLTVPLGTKRDLAIFAGGGVNKHKTSIYTLDNIPTNSHTIAYNSFNINGGLAWNF